VLNDFGCFSEDSAIVSVDPLPRAAFELLQVNDSVIRLTDKSQFSDEILWQFGDGDTSTLSNPEHTFTADGNYNITLTSINDCGSEDSSIIITIILPKKESIGDLEFWKELQLYPNPSTGHIVIEFSNGLSGEIELEVLDAAGQLISTGTGFKSGPQFKQALDLTDLEAGVYWIKIRMNGSEISRLLVIY
jgi:PKD repeat protein